MNTLRLALARKLCPQGWRVVPAFFTNGIGVSNSTMYTIENGSLSTWQSSTGAWDGKEA